MFYEAPLLNRLRPLDGADSYSHFADEKTEAQRG